MRHESKCRPLPIALTLLLLFLAGLIVYCFATSTPAADPLQLELKAPEDFTMGELEYLLLYYINEDTSFPYRIGTNRLLLFISRFLETEKGSTHLLSAPEYAQIKQYMILYFHAQQRAQAFGPPLFWRNLRSITIAQIERDGIDKIVHNTFP